MTHIGKKDFPAHLLVKCQGTLVMGIAGRVELCQLMVFTVFSDEMEDSFSYAFALNGWTSRYKE